MKLMTDLSECVQYLTEGTGESKSHYITGIFAQADTKNRNGRVYPVKVLDREVNRYVTEMVKTKRALGELNHPNSPTVNPERACHIITELKRDGTNFIGKAKILDTPVGRIVKTLLDEGVSIGVSTRGLGSLKERNGYNEVQDDFRMTAIDTVADPSAPDAFVTGIMESKEWVYVDGVFMEKEIDATKSFVKESHDVEAAKLLAFENFIRKIAGC